MLLSIVQLIIDIPLEPETSTSWYQTNSIWIYLKFPMVEEDGNISMMHLVERYCENEALISLKKKKEEDNET